MPADPRPPVVVVVAALSIGVHAAVLAALTAAPTPSVQQARGGATAVSVRMLERPSAAVAERPAGLDAMEPRPPIAVDGAGGRLVGAVTAEPTRRVVGIWPEAMPAAAPTVGAAGRAQTKPAPAPNGSKDAPAENRLPAASAYLRSTALDQGPTPEVDIELVYPPEAGMHDGTVTVRLLIDEHGSVTEVGIVRSEPPGVFDAAAVAAFSSARFSPGRLAGLPVKSQLTAQVEFKYYNRGANVSGRSY